MPLMNQKIDKKWPVTKVDSFDVTNEPLVAVTNLEKFLNLDSEISEKNFIYNSTKVRIFNLKNHFTLLVSKMSKIIEKNIRSNILWNYFNNISRGFTAWRISTQLMKSLVRHFVIMTRVISVPYELLTPFDLRGQTFSVNIDFSSYRKSLACLCPLIMVTLKSDIEIIPNHEIIFV